MNTKKIFITGSTDGIGKLAAAKLAKDGHQIILHGRNAEKLARVIAEIKQESNNDKISGYIADLSDLSAVDKMIQSLQNDHDTLDVLINNAGIFKTSSPRLADGQDVRLVVNYLAPYMITESLLPALQKSTDGRIINLSSAAQASVSIAALKGQIALNDQAAYAQSKLALTMWTFDLAKRYTDLTITAVNPGSLLNTNMVKEAYGRFWSSADKGANLLYDLAVDPKYKGETAKYFDNDLGDPRGAFGPAHSDAYDQALIDELLLETRGMLGID